MQQNQEEFISKGTDSIGGYQVALIDEFSMISKSNFKSEEYRENPDHVRFWVWRNKTTASLNDYVRS
ncbi:MAG: hypothetical protein QNJ72_22490 [Pleurocapsa sp. MO_226.B13]|nr:hypothetical protein [Pleurocapsa sp. MO_226.B13]